MAFGWPVKENGPLPGRPILPVARCRLQIALTFQVPRALWLSPIVQSDIHRGQSARIFAPAMMSSTDKPVISATRAGG